MKEVRNLGPLLQLGWVVALSVLIPLGVGLWLDRRLGTAPLFILIGALVGIFASTVAAVRVATRTIAALGQPPKPVQGDHVGAGLVEDPRQGSPAQGDHNPANRCGAGGSPLQNGKEDQGEC